MKKTIILIVALCFFIVCQNVFAISPVKVEVKEEMVDIDKVTTPFD